MYEVKINFETMDFMLMEYYNNEENYETITIDEAIEFYCRELDLDLINLGFCTSEKDIIKALEEISEDEEYEVVYCNSYVGNNYYVYDKLDDNIVQWDQCIDYYLKRTKEYEEQQLGWD